YSTTRGPAPPKTDANTSQDPSTATARTPGLAIAVTNVPFPSNSSILLLPVSATQTSPKGSIATPVGSLRACSPGPPVIGVATPLGAPPVESKTCISLLGAYGT